MGPGMRVPRAVRGRYVCPLPQERFANRNKAEWRAAGSLRDPILRLVGAQIKVAVAAAPPFMEESDSTLTGPTGSSTIKKCIVNEYYMERICRRRVWPKRGNCAAWEIIMKLIIESSLYGLGFAVAAFGMVVMLSANGVGTGHLSVVHGARQAPVVRY